MIGVCLRMAASSSLVSARDRPTQPRGRARTLRPACSETTRFGCRAVDKKRFRLVRKKINVHQYVQPKRRLVPGAGLLGVDDVVVGRRVDIGDRFAQHLNGKRIVLQSFEQIITRDARARVRVSEIGALRWISIRRSAGRTGPPCRSARSSGCGTSLRRSSVCVKHG